MENKQLQTQNLSLTAAEKIDTAIGTMLAESKNMGAFKRAIAKAEIIAMIDHELDESGSMASIMKMQGKQYGFKTDSKSPQGYSQEIVKNCLIEAAIRGVEPTGNQFNILGGNCYITKEGCKHILTRMNIAYRLMCSLSRKVEGGMTIVPVLVIWIDPSTQKEKKKELDIQVTVFEGVTKESAKEGMAKRDAMAWLIEELTGTPMPIGDLESSNASPVEFTAHEVVEKTVAQVEVKKADKKEQEKFDKYISKATNKEDLDNRVNQCVVNGGFASKEYFDDKVYNEKLTEFAKGA